MALPNGTLQQALKTEEVRAAQSVKSALTREYAAIENGKLHGETTEIEAIGKIDGLEIRLKKRIARFV